MQRLTKNFNNDCSQKFLFTLNKQQIKMFHLNREYYRLIKHILNSLIVEKSAILIDKFIFKISSNYKIYVKLRKLSNLSFKISKN
jgi:hypothetical protein